MRIKFSGGHGAMYGQMDLFCHLVAMRGKRGYGEGSSNTEDVDSGSPPLPSGGGVDAGQDRPCPKINALRIGPTPCAAAAPAGGLGWIFTPATGTRRRNGAQRSQTFHFWDKAASESASSVLCTKEAQFCRGKYQNTHAAVKQFIKDTLAPYGKCLGICESTARMWIKTYEGFEAHGIPIIVANPFQLGLRKSGAKTDTKDAERLANKGRVNDIGDAACHVYGEDTRRALDLLRQMILLKQERTRYLNRQHSLCEKYDYPI